MVEFDIKFGCKLINLYKIKMGDNNNTLIAILLLGGGFMFYIMNTTKDEPRTFASSGLEMITYPDTEMKAIEPPQRQEEEIDEKFIEAYRLGEKQKQILACINF